MPTPATQIQLVDAPTPSASVLFYFNTNTGSPGCSVRREGLSFGIPELIGDVEAIDPLYGPRIVTFTVRIVGTKSQALVQQSTMARALLNPGPGGRGWLKVQLTPLTKPVWFRTWRPRPDAMVLDNVTTGPTGSGQDVWDCTVSVPCEAFAYGERVTLDAVLLNNDPAASTNPCRIVLPGTVGDAPAPIRIRLASGEPLTGERWMIAAHAAATQRVPTIQGIGGTDGFTAGADTGASATGTNVSGGNYREVTFATNTNLVERLRRTGYPSGMTIGRYKVLVRAVRVGATGTFSLRFMQQPGQPVYGPTVTMAQGLAGSNYATWVDLGDFTIPVHGPPKSVTAFLPNTGAAAQWTIEVGQLSGTSALRLDAVMFVPLDVSDTVESRVLYADFRVRGGAASGTNVWDGDAEAWWSLTSGGRAEPSTPVLAGTFPRVVPGVNNVLTMLRQVNGDSGSSNGDNLSTSANVEVSYHPRYLYLGDS